MLKDSRSYEVQIIDAVRSVNKALGGTYGTSSAIYKSEFNQYEVQLIDAIKGIGRTLSGKGLSLAGGGVGDLSGYATAAQFQDLSRRVTVLESESFFRLVDGNVTLKEQYQNLWVPGWLAAGGIGSDGGGGGGSDVSWGTKSGNTRPLTVDGTTETLLLDGALAGYVTTKALNTALAGYATNLALAGKQDKYPFTISGVSGDTYNLSDFLTSQSIYGLTLSAGIFSPGTYTPNSEAKTFNIPTTLDHIEDGTNRKLSDYVTLHTAQTIDGAKTFTTNPLTIGQTSSLSVHASSHIDIGPLRIEYDSANKALHITKKDSSDTTNYSFYADGFVSAGGIQ